METGTVSQLLGSYSDTDLDTSTETQIGLAGIQGLSQSSQGQSQDVDNLDNTELATPHPTRRSGRTTKLKTLKTPLTASRLVTSKPKRGRPRTIKSQPVRTKPAQSNPALTHPVDLITIMTMLRDMSEDIKHLKDINKTNADLVKQLSRKTADNEELHKEVATLRKQLVNKTVSPPNDNVKSLLIGSSIVRDIDEAKLNNTEVICIRGGKISDIHKKLLTMKRKFDHIYLQVGSNDCSEREDVKLISEDYTLLIRTAKQCSSSVTVSSQTPRIGATQTQERIDQLNGFLLCHCQDEDVIFNDNDINFRLKDESINTGYICADKVHLSFAGTNSLAKNLKLKSSCDDVTLPKNKRFDPLQKKSQQQPQNKRQTQQHQPNDSISPVMHPQSDMPRQSGYNNTRKPRSKQTYTPQQECHFITSSRDNLVCLKCGEPGHLSPSCWHPNTVRCHSCRELGHKSSRCPKSEVLPLMTRQFANTRIANERAPPMTHDYDGHYIKDYGHGNNNFRNRFAVLEHY
ncbi:unnamed protein product [Owenia fusiformis]|uniref:Uncharacterized protein n=1 Tax=Owenia fusiformis TaxID=6347 RepID=A0A8J1TEU8_OWEFU|nr:unnamed protein product [Owenia fusiformis]